MGNQAFKIGDVVAIHGQVKWVGEGRVEVELADCHAARVDFNAAAMVQPNFEAGDVVIIEGEPGKPFAIKTIDGEFAWLFSEIEGFDTVELSSLRRPDQNVASANPR